MKFTLKDYQEEAIGQVLDRLRKARRRWRQDGDRSSISLSATTGAGKTVMAAAVFEALFYGNDEFNFEPDPGAVVIWFSDDPSLNTQSQWRLLEASDRLSVSSLVTIESSFASDRLEAGKVYFLNTQKLSRNSLLVRGHDPAAAKDGAPRLMPDDRAFTIWDIIQNTIEHPDLTLYLVLDEAHRGMREGRGGGADGKPTIVRQLINGTGAVPGVPVVLGISATVDRFDKAMEEAKNRDRLPDVKVDAQKVQDSGLLKDTIILDVPDEVGDFRTVLLRRATDKLKEISDAWLAYERAQHGTESVVPLMVLQVPNSPDPNDVGAWLDVIFSQMPELQSDICVANVFGEHRMERFGRHDVPYVEPQRVQESPWVRVLVAKDAISTGWDCPRAEVMVSFRPASDQTHITQLLGRMVRAPLARRIPGNDRLNAVDCLLPHFDRKKVKNVVSALKSGGGDGEAPAMRRVLVSPARLTENRAIPPEVWDKLLSLPSQSLPRTHARPVKRLTILAHELAYDGLVEAAGHKAHERLHGVLDTLRAELAGDIASARRSVLMVEGKTIRADVSTGGMSFDDFVEAADRAVIDEAYGRAARTISPDVARTYTEHVARGLGLADEHEALDDAREIVAAMGLVPIVKDRLEAEAETMARDWLLAFRSAIKALPDDRQDAYRDIRQMSAAPLDSTLAKPTSWERETKERQADGSEIPLDRWPHHLLCDADGLFPVSYASSWEEDVLSAEMKKEAVIGWYRNPGTPGQDSLGITYQMAGEPMIQRPDFIFFRQGPGGEVLADIVDPHDHNKGDSLARLKGLASYAAAHGSHYRSIRAVAKVDGTYRALDLMNPGTRAKLEAAESAAAAYRDSTSLKSD